MARHRSRLREHKNRALASASAALVSSHQVVQQLTTDHVIVCDHLDDAEEEKLDLVNKHAAQVGGFAAAIRS